MLLSNVEIREAVALGELTLDPLDLDSGALQPASVDLRLSANIRIQRSEPISGISVDPENLDVMDLLGRYTDSVDISGGWDFKPGMFVLGNTVKRLAFRCISPAASRGEAALPGSGWECTSPLPRLILGSITR